MSKFNKKEAKEKVLKTKIGKNTKKAMTISIIIFIIAFIINMILMDKCNSEDCSLALAIAYPISNLIFAISGLLTCYFDGKMDGLIASHKK